MGKRKRSGSWSKGDDAKKSDDWDSQEEMDVDVCAPRLNAVNVRCSARVQEKQEKLRREASPSKVCPVENASLEVTNGGGPVKENGFKVKVQNGAGNGEDEVVVPTDEKTAEVNVPVVFNGGDQKRKKRTWELWSQYDKQLFFEALNEFGKDFDAIQSYIANKVKSKNKTIEPTQIKKKEQVRHFYYRSWNKIQKFLRYPKDMKKVYQELYGLINYGELRKKQRVLNGKTAAKLMELVEKGSTTIKIKGKTLRIKTPVCQALKKINNLSDVEQTKVPTKVVVELLPKDGTAWTTVQSLSHNPRVRSLVSLQRTLASIITHLEERWKSSSDRIKEQMLTTFGKPTSRHLRVIPSCKLDRVVPIFKTYETASSAKISLSSFSNNVLGKPCKEQYSDGRKRTKSGSAVLAEAALDSQAEGDGESSDGEAVETKEFLRNETFRGSPVLKDNPLDDSGDARSFSKVRLDTDSEVKLEDEDLENGDGAVPDSDDGQSSQKSVESKNEVLENTVKPIGETSFQISANQSENANCGCYTADDKAVEPEDVFPGLLDEEVLRRGWTAEEASTLTVGEVYLLVGSDDKLSFEYAWDEAGEDPETHKRTQIMLERLITVARNLKKKKQNSTRNKTVGPVIGSPSNACPNCGQYVMYPPQPPPTGGVELGSGALEVPANPVTVTATVGVISSPAGMQRMEKESVISCAQSAVTNPIILVASDIRGNKPTTSEIEQNVLISASVQNPTSCFPSSKVDSDLVSTSKVKKIVPTFLSPACSGSVLAGCPPIAPRPERKITKDTTDEPFCPPPTSVGVQPILPRLRPGETLGSDDAKIPKVAPKPFLDLPKGNRRLGRPCCKKNIVPRYLPLLPKTADTSPQNPVWDLNKPGVQALYVGGSTQIMVPVTSISLKSNVTPSPIAVTVVNSSEPEEPSKETPSASVSSGMDILQSSSALLGATSKSSSLHALSRTNTLQDLLPSSSIMTNNNISIDNEKLESNLSLSSFMDLSLPESTKLVAAECLKSDKFMDAALGNSSCSISLSNFLSAADNSVTTREPVLQTYENDLSPKKGIYNNSRSPLNLIGSDSQQWLNTEGNELSLGSLLMSTLEQSPAVSTEAANDMNFQSIIDDSNNHLDFTSKFNELVAELDSNNSAKN